MSADFSWAAGFFDGEGSVGFYGNAGSHRICASVAQKDRRPLERLQAVLGFGRIGKPRPDSGVSYWQVTSISDVWKTYSVLRAYLSRPKIEQFERALIAMRARKIVQPHSQQSRRCLHCGRKPRARNLCWNHYMQWYRKAG